MEHDPHMERSKLVEVIQNFVNAQSLRTHRSPTCTRCGQAMRFLEMTAWLYGSDSGWALSLPACICDREPVNGTSATSNAYPERTSFMEFQIESVTSREC